MCPVLRVVNNRSLNRFKRGLSRLLANCYYGHDHGYHDAVGVEHGQFLDKGVHFLCVLLINSVQL